MGLLFLAILVFVIIRIIKRGKRRKEEKLRYDPNANNDSVSYKKSEYIPCGFQDGFSEAEFQELVRKEANKIRRIVSVQEYGGKIHGTVQSQSGISDWYFTLDFNRDGHITGEYSTYSENKESNIPSRLGDNIAAAVRMLGSSENNGEYEAPSSGDYGLYCPYCGEFTAGLNVQFCSYCGKQLM